MISILISNSHKSWQSFQSHIVCIYSLTDETNQSGWMVDQNQDGNGPEILALLTAPPPSFYWRAAAAWYVVLKFREKRHIIEMVVTKIILSMFYKDGTFPGVVRFSNNFIFLNLDWCKKRSFFFIKSTFKNCVSKFQMDC